MKKFYLLLSALILMGGTLSFGQNALSFGGNSENVSCGQLDLTAFTVEAWIKTTSSTRDEAIVSLISSNTGYNFELHVNNGSLILTCNDAAYWTDVNSITPIKINTWYHVAVTCNGLKKYELYINGVLDNTFTATNNHMHESATMYIGRRNGSGNQYYYGLIDDVRIWNVARTQAEIAANMNSELTNPSSFASLVAYYTFNQGVANGVNAGVTTLTDTSVGATHPGTLNSFKLTGTSSNWVPGLAQYVLPTIASTSLNAAAGTTPINVAANTPWTAVSNANWLTLLPASGSTNATVTATFTANNTSMVSRSATVTFTGTNAETQTITFTQNPGIIITPAFTSLQTTYNASNNNVNFTNATSVTGTTITSWAWSFGDGTTSTEQNPIHTYAANGTYTVKLTVSDGTNNKYIEKTIIVHNDIIMRNATLTITSDKNFYDSGHTIAEYANSETYVLVLKPATAGKVIQIDFSTIVTENTYDYIYIYDSETISATPLATYTGTYSTTQTVKATNTTGALCVKFTSDGSGSRSGWSAVVKQVDATVTAVEPNTATSKCSVFPTQFTNQLTVSTPEAVSGTYTIININGSVVAKGQLDGNKTELQLSNLKTGIYLLKVDADNLNKTFKVVKK